MIDFRQQQCSYFNKKEFKNLPANVTWITHLNGISREESCKLYCKAKETGLYYLLSDKVIDGTDCMETDKCLNGICVKSGCDNVIYSKKGLDSCRVCGGNNSTCNLVEGLFWF